jgi:hypothetical protein
MGLVQRMPPFDGLRDRLKRHPLTCYQR